jgi:hypothetical protein
MRYMKYLINITLLLILVISMMPYKVQASTYTLTVDGDNGYIYYIGSPSDWSAMNIDDGDASITAIGMSSYPCWSFTPAPNAGTITSVTYYYKVTKYADTIDPYLYPFAKRGASISPLGVHWVTLMPTYTLYSATWVTDPFTGLAWDYANLNNTYFGNSASYSTGAYYITYAYIVVTYASTSPVVATSIASDITYSGSSHNATLNGEIISDGGQAMDLRGFAWSVTSNSTAPGNIVPPATYTSNWTEGASAIGAFSHNIGGLTKGTTYYYRAYSHNTVGYGWGEELSFTALNDPSISILAATNVSTSTARLNASVTSSGGQTAQVSFEYGTTASLSFTSFTTNVTHNTGDVPYADISGLTALGTSYTYRARIVNDVSSQVSANATLITEAGVTEPNSLSGIPTATTISLAWVKGVGYRWYISVL